MLQIKTFREQTDTIDDAVNAFLRTLKTEAIKDIDVRDSGFAVIQYEIKDAWTDRICSECKYLDDGGSCDSVIGLCQECGGRRRFNNKACQRFKDIRD